MVKASQGAEAGHRWRELGARLMEQETEGFGEGMLPVGQWYHCSSYSSSCCKFLSSQGSRRCPKPFAHTIAFDLDDNRSKVQMLFPLDSLGNTASDVVRG